MKYWSHICLVASLVIIAMISQCAIDRGRLYDQSKAYLDSKNDTITFLKNGIAQKPAVEVGSDMFKQILKERDDLTKALKDAQLRTGNVHNITQVVTKIDIDTITIALHDTIPCDDFAPIPFRADSQYYSIAGSVGKRVVRLTDINFPDSLYVINADKKPLFRKNKYIVSVGHSNPHVKTVGLTSLTVTEEKKWWQNPWIGRAVFFVAGAYGAKQLLK